MNKKSFIVLCALVMATTLVHAQTSSGNMMVGGGLMLSSSSREGGSASDQSSFTVVPSFGYFISDNFAVGTTLEISTGRTGTGAGKTVDNDFAIGPFARYYMFTSNEQFGFFGQAQVTFGTSKTDPPVGDVVKRNHLSFALAPGAVYFFNEHWAAEFGFSLFSIRSEDPNTDVDDNKRTSVNFGLNSFSPNLGIRYHF